ncbi:MAG TPA: efflux RND transporter permease subunit [Bacillota bacterium]|nr:efflux RND transporter permease subunit [Bacillota bacterium]
MKSTPPSDSRAPAGTSSTSSHSGGLGLADLCIKRPVFATMINLLLVVLGWFCFQSIGVDQLPNVDLPIVTVTTTLRGASPEEMETSVTKPLEEIINTVQGIDELSSVTREGVSSINVQFLLERNRDVAAQDVRDKVNTILARLPEGTDPPIIDKFDIDASPVVSISVSAPRDLKEITFITDKQIKQNLETVQDVGAVNIVGGRPRAVQIAVDLGRLRARGLTIQDVSEALRQQNLEVPGGRVDQGKRELIVRTLGRMREVKDFNELIVANFNGQPIYLKDIATISDSIEEPRSLSRLNGNNSVTLVVRKQSGSNTVKLIGAVKQRLDELKAILPPDFKLTVIRDQSIFINRSLDEISFHLVLGAVLVALTVFFFLHDWRGTVIASVAIPASLIATFTLMRAMGYTLNNFTMLGMVFAVGIVIDDAIVVLENIHRTMEEKGWSGLRAASYATREIALAVMATTLSLVVIFLPLAFMQGRIGRFFSSYGVTVAFAIMVSLFISFTLTPMLASRFLRHTEDERLRDKKAHGGPLMGWLSGHYIGVLRWCLHHRWVVVLSVLGCMASLVLLMKLTTFNFMPQDDSSEFEIAFQTPEGSTLQRTAEIAAQIEQRVKAIRMDGQPAVTDTLITIGETSGRVGKGEGDVTRGTIYCRLPELGGRLSTLLGHSRRWSQFQAMGQARRILADFPDLRAGVQLTSGIGGGGRNADIQFNLVGPDLDKLSQYSDRIITRLRERKGIVDLDTTLSNRKPELQAHIDRAKASQFGLRVNDIATTLRTLVGGDIVGTYKEADDQYDVWLRANPAGRNTQEALEQIMLRAGGVAANESSMVQLANFLSFEEARGPNQIDRYQRQRKVTVIGNLVDYPLSEAMTDVRQVITELNLPADYQVIFTGRAKTMQETFQNFFIAFGLAMVFMYMILAAQFEHFVQPIAIMLAVPLSLPFALLTMILLGEPLNIYGIFGLFMLFGIVKKNGILQIDYTNTLRARGMDRESAILQANRVRLRPILMTTMMLVVSMIPIALGTGPGSGGRASMAKVIIGGQMLCLLLTLLVTPISYSLFDDLGKKFFSFRRRPSPRPEPAREAEPASLVG